MDYEQDNKRMNVQVDRLSNLPDDLIHKILSFVGTKEAIETSALSSRWRFIWTSIPYLKFSTKDFSSLPKFSKFVTHVLSDRNNHIEVSFVELSFRGKASQAYVRKIISYIFSHNIQKLTVTCLRKYKDIEFPLSLFCSESNKHLILTGYFITLALTWALPSLTTLYLKCITLDDDNIDLFSNCPELKDLTLDSCRVWGTNGFLIRHSRLSNLSLESVEYDVNVEAPKLKNLRFRQCGSVPFLKFSTDGVRSLEKVNLILYPSEENAHKVVGLLQEMHKVKFLTLNMEFVECLSSFVELVPRQPSLFANLKSLKIYPQRVSVWDDPKEKVIIPIEVKSYFLDGTASATLTMVSREEIIIMKNVTSTQNLMSELQVLLEQEKGNTDTEMAHMHAQPEAKMQPQIRVSMEQIYSSWEDLGLQIVQKKIKACRISSNLQSIEALLTKLPESKRALFQPCFSSLCAEADIVMNKITDWMKIQCDENQSRLSVSFHEIATALQRS